MTPWSIGCNTDVVLGDKKTRWMFVKFEIDGCAGQLSIIRTIFLPSTRNFWSSFRTQFSNISLSIQLFFCDVYWQGRYFDVSKAARFFWSANDEHRQLFSSSTCCGHSSESQLALLPPRTLFSFEVVCFLGKTLVKQTKFVCVESVLQFVIRQNGWERGFVPGACHLICNWLTFTTDNFQGNAVPEKVNK